MFSANSIGELMDSPLKRQFSTDISTINSFLELDCYTEAEQDILKYLIDIGLQMTDPEQKQHLYESTQKTRIVSQKKLQSPQSALLIRRNSMLNK